MHRRDTTKWQLTALLMAMVLGLGPLAQAQTDPDKAVDKIPTATPIKHVIIIVGENRSFDHLFATFKPRNGEDKVLNLLSERIINEDGTLPNPKQDGDQVYVPRNMPAIGDLFDMFNFDHGRDGDHGQDNQQ